MTLPEQLHAIAERLDALESQRLDVLAELWVLAGELPGEVVDRAIEQSASQAPAGSDGAGVDVSPVEAPAPAAPIHAGAVRDDHGRRSTRPKSAGSTPATRSSAESPLSAIGMPGGRIKCPLCDRTFRDNRGYPAHARSHRAMDGRALAVASSKGNGHAPDKDPREIDEPCQRCGQRFTWSPALETHLRTCRGVQAVGA